MSLTVNEENLSQTHDGSDWTGAGSQEDPYQISTAADLELLATKVNAGTTYANNYFKVTTDIDLSTLSGYWTVLT